MSYGDGSADYDDAGYEDEQKMGGVGINKELAVGNVNDRSYVLRDNMLGVFKQTQGILSSRLRLATFRILKGSRLILVRFCCMAETRR